MSDNRFDKLDNKVDKIQEEVSELKEVAMETKTILAINTESLREHMRRSDALEESNEMLARSLEIRDKNFDAKIAPLEQFVDRAKFLGIVIGTLAATLVTLNQLGILRLFGH